MEDVMREPVRWGVLSTARIGRTRVIPALAAADSGRVVAVSSRDHARAATVAAASGADRSYGSYEELVADPDVEAVYNPLPNHLHLPWTLAAIEAGKHVLCEKPLATSAGDVRTMVDAAERAGVVLMEAFMYRYHPQWVEVRRRLDDGAVGEPRAIRAHFTYRNTDPDDIRNVAAYGGGGLLDIGCYPVSASRWLYGAEPEVVVVRRVVDEHFGVDAMASAVLDFGGRHASFTVSTQLEPSQGLEIHGTGGRVVVEVPFNPGADRSTRVLVFAGGGHDAPPTEVVEVPAVDQYGRMVQAFARAVRGDRSEVIAPSDAIANAEVLDRLLAG
jgi:predicted dehydrogenase